MHPKNFEKTSDDRCGLCLVCYDRFSFHLEALNHGLNGSSLPA